MHVVAQVAAGVAALVHVVFFLFESVWFPRPQVYRRFLIGSAEEAASVRTWAFNQGFYNLFLALGVVAGLVAVNTGAVPAGRAVVAFGAAVMVGAGVVLLITDRRMARAAAIQAVPPLVALAALAL
ncbi:MAG: DUF1304 domain-containing protein [Micromonosporaceae bacterium]